MFWRSLFKCHIELVQGFGLVHPGISQKYRFNVGYRNGVFVIRVIHDERAWRVDTGVIFGNRAADAKIGIRYILVTERRCISKAWRTSSGTGLASCAS